MAFTTEEAAEFVALLQQFTDAGAAEWLLQHQDEPVYVYCFLAGERIDFIVYRSGDDPVSVWSSDIAAVGGRWRHHELLFLAPEEMPPSTRSHAPPRQPSLTLFSLGRLFRTLCVGS